MRVNENSKDADGMRVEVRPAAREDFFRALCLREQWTEQFHAGHSSQERWWPGTYRVWDIPDEATILRHLAGRDGCGAAIATAEGIGP
jgi:hypothetical protein